MLSVIQFLALWFYTLILKCSTSLTCKWSYVFGSWLMFVGWLCFGCELSAWQVVFLLKLNGEWGTGAAKDQEIYLFSFRPVYFCVMEAPVYFLHLFPRQRSHLPFQTLKGRSLDKVDLKVLFYAPKWLHTMRCLLANVTRSYDEI